MIHIILDFDSCFFEQACIKLMQIWCENFRKLFYMDKNLCFLIYKIGLSVQIPI